LLGRPQHPGEVPGLLEAAAGREVLEGVRGTAPGDAGPGEGNAEFPRELPVAGGGLLDRLREPRSSGDPEGDVEVGGDEAVLEADLADPPLLPYGEVGGEPGAGGQQGRSPGRQ